MKLLLTSTGVTNKSIHSALEDLIGKPTKDSTVAFIPTAVYGDTGGKSWFVKEIQVAHDLGWKDFNIVELTAFTKDELSKLLNDADVIYMNGGDNFYLMNKIIQLDLEDVLKELLKTKVYVGSSAGSIVASSYAPAEQAKAFDEQDAYNKSPIDHYLGYVDFTIKPHLNSPSFPGRDLDWCQKLTAAYKSPFYALDDNSAVKVDGDKIEVVSEGTWKKFN